MADFISANKDTILRFLNFLFGIVKSLLESGEL